MFERIKEECELYYVESMDEDKQLDILVGIGWRKKGREIRDIVLEYMKKAYKIRKRYVR